MLVGDTALAARQVPGRADERGDRADRKNADPGDFERLDDALHPLFEVHGSNLPTDRQRSPVGSQDGQVELAPLVSPSTSESMRRCGRARCGDGAQV